VFAASGEAIELSPRGLVLVEGLGFARIAVMAPARRGRSQSGGRGFTTAARRRFGWGGS
jgi:hypothetical protein